MARDMEPAWGAPQLWAGGPVRSSMTKPQHLTAAFVKAGENDLFCFALVRSFSFWQELELGNSIQGQL